MTYHEETLKHLMDTYQWDENNIPVELIESLIDFRRRVLSINKPVFIKDNIPVMENWQEFAYCGMNNIDYIATEFYKYGFQEETPLHLNSNID
jgi:hypothetical protein